MSTIRRKNSRMEDQMSQIKVWSKAGLALGLVLWAGLGLAFGPEDALRYQDPKVPLVKAQLEAFERNLQAPPLSLILRPGYTFRTYAVEANS